MNNAIPRMFVTASLALITVAVAAGCEVCPTDAQSPTDYQVNWGPCDPQRTELANLADEVQCGTVSLPVDWRNPGGEHFTTRVYKKPAQGKSRGTIINFPSGPGETADIGFDTYGDVEKNFDQIGVDPRGVATTAQITCRAADIARLPIAPPLTATTFHSIHRESRKVARECTTKPASLKSHLDAYSYARDVEAVRAGMTDAKVVVTGFSYGTLQAARYLELFGNKVQGAVLAGVMSPGEGARTFQQTATDGLQALFDEFKVWCRHADKCSLPNHDASAALEQAKTKATLGEIPGKSLMGKKWDSAGVIQAFELAAQSGDFRAASDVLLKLSLGQAPTEASEQGPLADHNAVMPYPDAIVCSDFPIGVRNVRTARKIFQSPNRDIELSPNAAQYAVLCGGAPLPDSSAMTKFVAQGDFPILLISNRLDVSTPKEWASRVQEQIPSRAQHIVANVVGHGNMTADPLVTQEVNSYFRRL